MTGCHLCTSLAPLRTCACGEKFCSKSVPFGTSSCFEIHQQTDCAGRMAPRRTLGELVKRLDELVAAVPPLKEEHVCSVEPDEEPDTDCPGCIRTLVLDDEMDALAEHGLCFYCAYEALDVANERIRELEAQLEGKAPSPDIAPVETMEEVASALTVGLIERLLARARTGEVQDVIMVAILLDGSIATESTPTVDFIKRLGAIEHAKLRWYHEHMLECGEHDGGQDAG